MTAPLQFEWGETKAAYNIRKHGVSFEEAATVFEDPEFITFLDEEHSAHEERYITIGLSKSRGLLMVAHTDRGGRIRMNQRPQGDETRGAVLCRSRMMLTTTSYATNTTCPS